MMKEDQLRNFCHQGQFHGVGKAGMAPSPVGFNLFRQVLGIMDQQITALGKFGKICRLPPQRSVGREFVIRQKNQATAVLTILNPIPALRMIGFNTLYGEITQMERTVGNFFQVADTGLELIEGHRKIAITFAVVKDVGQTPEGLGAAVDVDHRGIKVNRLKKCHTQNMIPMGMSD